jgi:hypothetical protein
VGGRVLGVIAVDVGVIRSGGVVVGNGVVIVIGG